MIQADLVHKTSFIHRNPLQLRDFDHVALRVREFARSESFYVNVLGCKVVARNEEAQIIHLLAGSRFLDLVLLTGRMGAVGGTQMQVESRNMHHLCLAYEAVDFDALFAFLDENGIEHSSNPQINLGSFGEGTSIYIQDPDEHLIELKCYPSSESAT